jgi:hypothetical protein
MKENKMEKRDFSLAEEDIWLIKEALTGLRNSLYLDHADKNTSENRKMVDLLLAARADNIRDRLRWQ